MTTVKTSQSFRLTYRPEHEPDDMAKCRQLNATNIIELLRHNLGNSETTLITGDQYLCRVVTTSLAGARYPDLLIAFNPDLEAHRSSNGYIIADQDKPPDFVLEIASTITGSEDSGKKPRHYVGFGIPEYRRFDAPPNGRRHGAPTGRRQNSGRRIRIHPYRTLAQQHPARLHPGTRPLFALGARPAPLARPGNRPPPTNT